ADAAETVLLAADHALGPAPLTTEDEHAGRVADLRVYLRQHHADRDTAALGRLVSDVSPW
ncbi:MAG: Acyl-CoA dehydrogenase/oxidase domain protein, partial [Nocardioides sp.]|nr:Acyl-CoA dehydrogenase/oxidase domain protein [Nocardioides sp.]